jgi:hypothetical protein
MFIIGLLYLTFVVCDEQSYLFYCVDLISASISIIRLHPMVIGVALFHSVVACIIVEKYC